MCDQESEIRNGKSKIQNPESKIASISEQSALISEQSPFISEHSALISEQRDIISEQIGVILGFITVRFVGQTPCLSPKVALISVIYPPISRHFATFLRVYRNARKKIGHGSKAQLACGIATGPVGYQKCYPLLNADMRWFQGLSAVYAQEWRRAFGRPLAGRRSH